MRYAPHLKSFSEALRSPIARLIERGDIVEVIQGKLVISPKSGMPIPAEWLNENYENLMIDIASIAGINAFIYNGYSLGQYGPHKSETLTLQFTDLRNRSDAFAAFNVSLKRQRSGRNKEPKGSPLPKGEFAPPKAGEFVKLWQRTGLKNYNPSRLCRYMGNLKGLAYSASYSLTSSKPNKLANKSIDLLNLNYDELIAFMPSGCLSHAQELPNSCLSAMPKQSAESHVIQGLDEYSSTWVFDHGLRLKGNAVNYSIEGVKYPSNNINTNHWLDEYEKADGLSPY